MEGYIGSIIGVITGETRSLDSRAHVGSSKVKGLGLKDSYQSMGKQIPAYPKP